MQKAANESRAQIEAALQGTDMVFVTVFLSTLALASSLPVRSSAELCAQSSTHLSSPLLLWKGRWLLRVLLNQSTSTHGSARSSG